tara:strand:- start:574 stop:1467 length:894 start_codon:yes stop_codon:yes gene_type:complete
MGMAGGGSVRGYYEGGQPIAPGVFPQGNANDEVNRLVSERGKVLRSLGTFGRLKGSPELDAIDARLRELRVEQKEIELPTGGVPSAVAGHFEDAYAGKAKDLAGVRDRLLKDTTIDLAPMNGEDPTPSVRFDDPGSRMIGENEYGAVPDDFWESGEGEDTGFKKSLKDGKYKSLFDFMMMSGLQYASGSNIGEAGVAGLGYLGEQQAMDNEAGRRALQDRASQATIALSEEKTRRLKAGMSMTEMRQMIIESLGKNEAFLMKSPEDREIEVQQMIALIAGSGGGTNRIVVGQGGGKI